MNSGITHTSKQRDSDACIPYSARFECTTDEREEENTRGDRAWQRSETLRVDWSQ